MRTTEKSAPRRRARLLSAAVGTTMLSSLLTVCPLAPSAALAATTDTLAVDFSQSTGDFRGGASGTLYGLGDEGAPTQALINGAHITNSSQKAPFGTQHPSGDALKVEDGLFAKHGTEMDIYVQDYYPDWAYNGGQRPGDTRSYNQADGTYTNAPNGKWDYLEVVEFVAEAVATKSDHPQDYLFIPFNEPDAGNWYSNVDFFKTQFLPDWKAAYDKIQEVYARHGLGHARIGGPGDSAWHADRTAAFLDYAKQTNSLPDVFIWHELGIDNLATYRSHLAEYRSLETARGISPISINITEYGMLRDMGVPGQLIQWLSMFEDTKVDAQSAYWNYAGNLNDNTARPNGANGGWWMFKWYGDLEGSQTVKVTPPQLNTVDTLQGIGAVDRTQKRATVLFGGSNSDQVTLDLKGLDPATFAGKVDVEVRQTPLTGAEGLAATPRLITVKDGVSLADGAASVTVPGGDRYAGYQVIVTPDQDGTLSSEPTWSTSVEAENTTISGARVYTQDPQAGGGWSFMASGGRDVGSFNNAGAKADWTVTVPRDGTYRLQVIGATPGVPGRHALFVDGAAAGTIQYTADLALNDTSRWKYRGSAEVSVPLTAGQHALSVRASADGTTVLPNADITLDKFVLTDTTDGEPTVYPADTLRLYGGAAQNYDVAGRRGAAAIAGDGQRADTYVSAFDSGYYDVALDYRTTTAATANLTVNGRKVATLTADAAGDWRSTARLHLAQGINEIEIRSPEGILLTSLTTTRAAAADSAAVKIEAESGVKAGAARTQTIAATTGSNVSGGADVGYLGNGAGNTVTFPRQTGFDQPGLYDVVVGYANAAVSGAHAYNPQVVDRRLQVTEAGHGLAGQAYFRYTYAWNSYWQRTIPVEFLTAGGALTLGNDGDYAPNVDYIIVAPVIVGTPTTVSTATVTSVAPVVVSTSAGVAPALPSTVRATLSDGATKDVPVTWAAVDPSRYATPGATFDVAGTVAGSQIAAKASVSVIDDTAPTVTVTSTPADPNGANGWYTSPVKVTATATDDSGAAPVLQVPRDGGKSWDTYADQSVTDGTSVLQFRAADTAGNVSPVVEKTIKVDPTAPLAASTVDTAARTVTVTATDHDPASGVAFIETRTNGGAWARTDGATATVTAGAGATTVDYRATDVAGNVSAVGTVAVPPASNPGGQATVKITSADQPSTEGWYTQNVIVAFTAPSGTSVQYRLDGGTWKSGGSPVTVSTNGAHVIDHRLIKSNVVVDGSQGTVSVKLDKVLLTASVARVPSSGVGSPRNPVTVAFTGTDALSGIDRIEYKLNQGQWTSVAADTPVVVDTIGDYIVSYRSVDQAGNTSAVRTTTVRITADPATVVKPSVGTVNRGGFITFALAGYDRYDTVTIKAGDQEWASVFTDFNGAAKVTVKVPANAATGKTTLTAAGSDGNPSSATTITIR